MKAIIYTFLMLTMVCTIAKPPKKEKPPKTNCVEEAIYARSDAYKNYIDQLCKESFKQIDTLSVNIVKDGFSKVIPTFINKTSSTPENFIVFSYKTITLPSKMIECGINTKIIVQFIVDIDGSINNVSFIGTPMGYDLETAVIDMLKQAPPIQPAIVNGKEIPSYCILPIKIQIK